MTYIKNDHEADRGWAFLKSSRWIGYYSLIIVFSIVCVFLGNWQFDRRDEARAEINRIEQNYDAPPTTIDKALPDLDSYDENINKWHPVVLNGTYLPETYLARNRVSPHGVGSILIQPLMLNNGNIFFVERGWVDVNVTAGIPEVLPMPATGEVEVFVRLRASEQPIQSRETLGVTVGSVDLNELQRLVGQPAYTGSFGQLISETPAGETGVLPQKPERDEGPHLSYALQWYVFILIAICGAWYAARLEWKSLNSRAATENVEKKAKRSKRPKKLSDAELEDAYLDAEA